MITCSECEKEVLKIILKDDKKICIDCADELIQEQDEALSGWHDTFGGFDDAMAYRNRLEEILQALNVPVGEGAEIVVAGITKCIGQAAELGLPGNMEMVKSLIRRKALSLFEATQDTIQGSVMLTIEAWDDVVKTFATLGLSFERDLEDQVTTLANERVHDREFIKWANGAFNVLSISVPEICDNRSVEQVDNVITARMIGYRWMKGSLERLGVEVPFMKGTVMEGSTDQISRFVWCAYAVEKIGINTPLKEEDLVAADKALITLSMESKWGKEALEELGIEMLKNEGIDRLKWMDTALTNLGIDVDDVHRNIQVSEIRNILKTWKDAKQDLVDHGPAVYERTEAAQFLVDTGYRVPGKVEGDRADTMRREVYRAWRIGRGSR